MFKKTTCKCEIWTGGHTFLHCLPYTYISSMSTAEMHFGANLYSTANYFSWKERQIFMATFKQTPSTSKRQRWLSRTNRVLLYQPVFGWRLLDVYPRIPWFYDVFASSCLFRNENALLSFFLSDSLTGCFHNSFSSLIQNIIQIASYVKDLFIHLSRRMWAGNPPHTGLNGVKAFTGT